MKRTLKFSILAGLLLLLVFAVPSVSAYGSFEISGTYTDEGVKWLNEHWGGNITIGDVVRIAYAPEDVKKIKENVDPKLLEQIWSEPYFWGDQYPPHTGTDVTTPTGTNAKTTKVSGTNTALLGETESMLSPKLSGGISLTATPTGYSGGYITFGGSGSIYGYTGTVNYFKVQADLYGDSTNLQTAYTERYNYSNNPRVTLATSGVRTPVSGTLYQAQIIGTSSSPSYSASTWSSSYFYS